MVLLRDQKERSATVGGSPAVHLMQMPASIQKAQQVARNILNLSQSELEDLISPRDSDQFTSSVSTGPHYQQGCHEYKHSAPQKITFRDDFCFLS